MLNSSNCKYCGKEFLITCEDNTFYCSDKCYHEAWQILSALYEFHEHNIEKTWAEFKVAVW